MELNEEKILKKFEKYKGYSAVLFDNEGWRESESYEQGYNQALKDIKAPEILEMLKETTEVIKWYMDNSTSELPEPFFNIGANQIEQIEQLIKQATEL